MCNEYCKTDAQTQIKTAYYRVPYQTNLLPVFEHAINDIPTGTDTNPQRQGVS
jgi:hypothetical protein